MATKYLGADKLVEGGRFLRLAFLAIEDLVKDDHLQNAWDLFLWVPLNMYTFLSQPMADSVVKAYSRFVPIVLPNDIQHITRGGGVSMIATYV